MDFNGLHHALLELSSSTKDRDLKSYLLTMYPLLGSVSKKRATFLDVFEVLKASFSGTPLEIEPEWLDITQSPTENRMTRKFTAPGLENFKNNKIDEKSDDIKFTYDVLKFQIAELHKIGDAKLNDSNSYFGIQSTTGHDWYNFTAFSVLDCGINCIIDNKDNITFADWGLIGRILEDGRIYE